MVNDMKSDTRIHIMKAKAQWMSHVLGPGNCLEDPLDLGRLG